MLQLVLGRSGTGKTQYVYEQLAQLVSQGGTAVLLVPEQYSFESERTLLDRLGMLDAARVKVLSFTRLAQHVFDELGGVGGTRMDDATRTLLMSQAIEQVADRLTLYRRHVGDTTFLGSILDFLAECKQCTVTPSLLHDTAERLEDGTLRRKTEELSLIFGAYEALAEQSYLDPMDDLTALAARMPESCIVQGIPVYVDGFKGFTAQEFAVLEAMMGTAAELTVTLCTDTLTDTEEGLGLFSAVTRTANRLQELARRRHVAVASPIVLEENHRATCEPLRVLEQNCFEPLPEICEDDAPQVTVTACGDIYDECAYVARTLRRLLREEGERCRDCAIVARNLTEYQGVLEAALQKEGIPYYMDQRQDILTDPLIAAVLSALRIATGRWDTDELLRLIKTGMVGLSASSAARLENYVFMWNIDGNAWTTEWKGNPNGWEIAESDRTEQQLWCLNLLRRRVVAPLMALRGSLEGRVGGEAFAHAIYRYLTQIRADRMVRLQTARLRAAGETALAERQSRMWDVLMQLLDRFALALGSNESGAARLAELFELVARETDIGSVPQGLDAVQIGSADRIRFSSPRTVYMVGVNEGVFPAYPTDAGLISDAERRRLIELDVPMSDNADLQAAEERFFAYAALSAPSHRLFVTYLQGDTQGETFVPSSVVAMLDTVLPHHAKAVSADETADDVESTADAFSRLGECEQSTVVRESLRAALAQREEYRPLLATMDRVAACRPFAFENADTAASFFGDNMAISSSRVEQYHKCRFAYFCRYGLGVESPRPAELDSARFGTLTHYVMERCLPLYMEQGVSAVTREQVEQDTVEAVKQYVTEYVGEMQEQTKRFECLLDRLCRTAANLLWRVVLELRQSQFVPVDYELGIGLPHEESGEMVPATVLTLPDGARVRVVGKVDRVDVYRDGDAAYVRVVDYKSYKKDFRLYDVVEGINVQMLIYLFSIWQNGGERYGKVTPAGVLYLPSKQPVLNVQRGLDAGALERERLKSMKMNGLLLDDPALIRAMEADAAGLFIPATLKKDGTVSAKSSVASLAQFGKLKQKIESILMDMAATLRRGDVAALPLQIGDKDYACQYCEYRSVCGHEADDAVRFALKRDNKEVMEQIEAELASDTAK